MSYSKRNQDRWEKHQQLRKYSKDDTILMAESEEEVKSLLMRVKESERVGLNLKKKQNT